MGSERRRKQRDPGPRLLNQASRTRDGIYVFGGKVFFGPVHHHLTLTLKHMELSRQDPRRRYTQGKECMEPNTNLLMESKCESRTHTGAVQPGLRCFVLRVADGQVTRRNVRQDMEHRQARDQGRSVSPRMNLPSHPPSPRPPLCPPLALPPHPPHHLLPWKTRVPRS